MPLLAAVTRVEQWLRTHAPYLHASLRGPASVADLEALAATIGQPVPDQLAAWLRLYDGQIRGRFATFGDHHPLEAQAIAAEWRERCAHADDSTGFGSAQVRPGWWRPGWIPFAETGGGDLLVVDTDPADGGVVGQIVEWRHDHHERPVVAPSLADWLSALGDEFDGGVWSVHPLGFLEGPVD